MVMKWAVGEIAPRVDGVPGFVIDVEDHLYDTQAAAREYLQQALDFGHEASTEAQAAKLLRTMTASSQALLVVCPPIRGWVVFPVRDGFSPTQEGLFYLDDHRDDLVRRFTARTNTATGGGCAVVALAAVGGLVAGVAALAQIPWSA
ncbi:hypothetical protein [Glycomyces artemisiae]|uniref:Uncharacterized protein n=1 Tax=Glycomyces artemisiae TaxID=1076443 RepID=A0A2T0UX50_9ACTN|nr:hypothetical protein [Glycomyces artemisiae]PRY62492.1 hypothetical protein B0I28_101826 [Glycomyces artemisiae]